MHLRRPAAYGLSAAGSTSGRVLSADGEFGYAMSVGASRIGPFVQLGYKDVRLNGYTESGAAVGDGLIADNHYGRTEASIGLEASFGAMGAIRPSARIAYTDVSESGDSSAVFTLAAVPGSAQMVDLPTSADDFASAEFALEGQWAGFGWRGAVEVRDTKSETSGRLTIGIAKAF
jgi:uncharacterized protein with beta-barrel porin domain